MSDSTQSGQASPLKRWLPIAGAALLLLAIAFAVWWFFIKTHKLDVWREAKVPYSVGCKGGDCKVLLPLSPTHGGTRPKDGKTRALVYNPRIDDAVAQWGDCLQSIMTCMTKLKRNDDKGMRNCVAVSICPKECKERFAGEAGTDMDSSEAAFYNVFTDKEAVCRPDEP